MKNFTMTIKSISILVFVLLAASGNSFAKWKLKTDMPIFSQGRWGMQTFQINGKMYSGGGYEGNFLSANDFYSFDPVTKVWAPKNNLPGTNANRSGGIGFTINGKAYMGLGIENFNSFTDPWNFLTDLWEYDDATDTWTKKADLPGKGVGFTGVFILNNKAYVVGGATGKSDADGTNQVYEYDPATDKWTKKADYPATSIKGQPFAFAVNDKGYISCGVLDGLGTNETYEYDPVTDKWTKKSNYPEPSITAGVSFVANGVAYCGLGSKGVGDYSLSFYYYDPANDSWHYAAGSEFNFNGRMFAKVATINDKVYVGGGWRIDNGSQTFFRDWYEIDPAVAVNVDEVHTTNKILIYPNPANDIVYIASEGENIKYSIYSVTGILVQQGIIDNNKINTAEIPTGNYMLKLTSNNFSESRILSIE